MTRLTVVPLRSSPIQGNDQNLGLLSTPRLERADETVGKQTDTDISQNFHFGIRSGGQFTQELHVWEFHSRQQ